jgi:transcriptional regulator with XRE-family HTH domain
MTDISDITGISKVYLSNLNTGKKCNPGGIVIQQISEVLNVSADEVLKAIRG